MEDFECPKLSATESLIITICKKRNINLKQQILFVSQLIIIAGIKIIEQTSHFSKYFHLSSLQKYYVY